MALPRNALFWFHNALILNGQKIFYHVAKVGSTWKRRSGAGTVVTLATARILNHQPALTS